MAILPQFITPKRKALYRHVIAAALFVAVPVISSAEGVGTPVRRGNSEMVVTAVGQTERIGDVQVEAGHIFVVVEAEFSHTGDTGAMLKTPRTRTYLTANSTQLFDPHPVTKSLNSPYPLFDTAAGMRQVSLRFAFMVTKDIKDLSVSYVSADGLLTCPLPDLRGKLDAVTASKTPFPGVLQEVSKSAENTAMALTIHTCMQAPVFYGREPAAGHQFLIVDAEVLNLHPTLKMSIPPIKDAFKLVLDGDGERRAPIALGNMTPTRFWGEQIVGPAASKPAVLVFEIPDGDIKSAAITHLAVQGGINLQFIGDTPTMPEGLKPARLGELELVAEAPTMSRVHGKKQAPEGKTFLTLRYWMTNHGKVPIELDMHGYTLLVENHYRVYRTGSTPKVDGDTGGTQLDPGQPTSGLLTYLVPKQTGALTLVHLSYEGAIRAVVPSSGKLPKQPEPVAGPTGERSIELSLFKPAPQPSLSSKRSGPKLIVLDVGVRLNRKGSNAFFPFKPETSLEFHTADGRIYKPAGRADELVWPLLPGELWSEQLVRGHILFEVSSALPGAKLVIPFAAGPTSLAVPEEAIGVLGHASTVNATPQPKPASSGGSGPGNPLGGLMSGEPPPQPEPKPQPKNTPEPTDPPTVKPEPPANLSMHPMAVTRRAQAAMNEAGLKGVVVKVRRAGELILLGKMSTREEIAKAESIAKDQPGIAKVLNRIKLAP